VPADGARDLFSTGSESTALLSATFVDLGDLGGASSVASAINNLGQVVGVSDTSLGATHVFLYSNGKISDLGITVNTRSGFEWINDSGTVVVSSDPPVLYPSMVGGWEDTGGVIQSLVNFVPSGLNYSGQVAGFTSLPGGSENTEAAIYSDGTVTPLEALFSKDGVPFDSAATAINDLGEVVGQSGLPSETGFDTFLYKNGTMTNLGLNQYYPLYINNAGQIFVLSNSGAYVDTAGNLTMIPCCGGIGNTAMNNHGDVVVTLPHADAGGPEGALYKDGQLIPLNSLLPPSFAAWHLQSASGINDSDQIVGTGLYNGEQHAYLLSLGSGGSGGSTGGSGEAAGPQVTDIASTSQNKKGLTGITVVFDEALNAELVNDKALFNVLGAVKKHHRTVYTKPVRIPGVSFDGQNRVTLKLAKPYKGAVKITVLAGIRAADGASSATDYSAVLD
jgi:probable HAF family extracellular repeat protein